VCVCLRASGGLGTDPVAQNADETEHVPQNASPPYTLNLTSLHLVTRTLDPTLTPCTQHYAPPYTLHPPPSILDSPPSIEAGGNGREEDHDEDNGVEGRQHVHITHTHTFMQMMVSKDANMCA
jgi:hypothetical protein